MKIQIRQIIPAPVTTTLTGALDGDADVDDDEVDVNNRLQLTQFKVLEIKESTKLKIQPIRAIKSNKQCIVQFFFLKILKQKNLLTRPVEVPVSEK